MSHFNHNNNAPLPAGLCLTGSAAKPLRRKNMKKILFYFALASTLTIALACPQEVHPQLDVVPQQPQYNDNTQWYVNDKGNSADIFYITSTETGDYTMPSGAMCHWADTYRDSLRTPIYNEMLGVDALLSGDLNFFSPYYRQCSLQSFTSNDTLAKRLPIAIDDVKRAFEYYLNNINHDRPFILAGFSQGAMIVLELLKEMSPHTSKRMIAAYVIGASISEQLASKCSNIVPASGSDDTGVTICYNSVRDTGCAMWPRSALAINPVNWRTDSTPATLVTEPSPLLPLSSQEKDNLTIHLDVPSGLLIVEGYSATDYVLPLVGKEGNYHSREIWLYRNHLRENMALRAATFLSHSLK